MSQLDLQVPLHSSSVQRAVLGAAMQDNSLMRGPLTGLSVMDFVGSSEQTLYGLMLQLSEDERPFDVITLCDELRQHGLIDRVGGEAFVVSLLDGVVIETRLISGHVKTLQKFTKRRLLCKRPVETVSTIT